MLKNWMNYFFYIGRASGQVWAKLGSFSVIVQLSAIFAKVRLKLQYLNYSIQINMMRSQKA